MWHRFFLEKRTVTLGIKKFPALMEPEGLSRCSQKPTNGPYLSQLNAVNAFSPYLSKIQLWLGLTSGFSTSYSSTHSACPTNYILLQCIVTDLYEELPYNQVKICKMYLDSDIQRTRNEKYIYKFWDSNNSDSNKCVRDSMGRKGYLKLFYYYRENAKNTAQLKQRMHTENMDFFNVHIQSFKITYKLNTLTNLSTAKKILCRYSIHVTSQNNLCKTKLSAKYIFNAYKFRIWITKKEP